MSVIVGLETEAGAQGHRRPEVALAAKCNGLRQKRRHPMGDKKGKKDKAKGQKQKKAKQVKAAKQKEHRQQSQTA